MIKHKGKEYYTVAEAAEVLHMSKQAIYKRISKQWKKHVADVNGSKCIECKIVDQEAPAEKEAVQQNTDTALEDKIKLLESMVQDLRADKEYLQKELAAKQATIEDYQADKESLRQQLTFISNRLMLVENTVENVDFDEVVENPAEPTADDNATAEKKPQETKKTSIWSRIFK